MERFLDLFDPTVYLRRSRIRLGKRIRADGVPAILLGVTCILAVVQAGRTVERVLPALPDALREAREMVRLLRYERKELAP